MNEVPSKPTPSNDTAARPTSALASPLPRRRHKWLSISRYLGPAFIVSVAYIDPGNFATNISSGTFFGYQLIWVILWSNLAAIFLQSLSAKLGIVTNHNLAELCRANFSAGWTRFLWVIGLLSVMATDLAEMLGGVLGFYLLFGIPLVWGGLLTGFISFAIAALKLKGQHRVEAAIGLFVATIGIAYVIELFLAKPDWSATLFHTIIPAVPNSRALLLAAGMLGATVMPHVIYLHSALVQHRRGRHDSAAECRRHYYFEKWDIAIAMNLAFIVNAAMVIVSAAVFHHNGCSILTIEAAHRSLTPLLGAFSSFSFGVALLASGLSSATVGTLAGEIIINGLSNQWFSLPLRRLVSMTPVIIILLIGINPMDALILSQVCLSFALPAAIIPLIILTSRPAIMGPMANTRLVKAVGWCLAGVIIGLNILLIVFSLLGK